MHEDKLERTRMLARFRKLAEDTASVALQLATQKTNVAREEQEAASERVDAAARWKALVGEEARLELATYEQALEMEEVAMTVERHAAAKQRCLGEQRDAVAEAYEQALNGTRVVDRRHQRLLHESIAHEERAESDSASDLWLARSNHANS